MAADEHPEVSEKESLEVAEASRQAEWEKPSFMRELFLGNFRLDIIHPFPLPGQERPEFTAYYRKLYDFLPKERIVMDTTTAALGYGLDYAFTVMERCRLAGLKGDPELNHPMSSGSTNAWAAREAWMKMDEKWTPRELRGPLWETITAQTLLLTGVDYFMMMHPAAANAIRGLIDNLMSGKAAAEPVEWVSLKV